MSAYKSHTDDIWVHMINMSDMDDIRVHTSDIWMT